MPEFCLDRLTGQDSCDGSIFILVCSAGSVVAADHLCRADTMGRGEMPDTFPMACRPVH